MFKLQSTIVKVASINPRCERHGEENHLAADLKFKLNLPNGVLDAFAKGLRESLFRKPSSGEQQDLIDGENALAAVRFPRLGAIRWDEEFPGYSLRIDGGGLGLSEPLLLEDVTPRKFQFEPMEGGSVAVTFSVICHPEAQEIGELCALIQQSVELTLTPPAAAELAKAA